MMHVSNKHWFQFCEETYRPNIRNVDSGLYWQHGIAVLCLLWAAMPIYDSQQSTMESDGSGVGKGRNRGRRAVKWSIAYCGCVMANVTD